MKYVVIEEKRGDIWTHEFDNKEEAIKKAEWDWGYLTNMGKKEQTITVLDSVDPDEESEYHLDGNPVWKNGELV